MKPFSTACPFEASDFLVLHKAWWPAVKTAQRTEPGKQTAGRIVQRLHGSR